MLRHQQLLLLRALAQARSSSAGGGTGGTLAIPAMTGSLVVAATQRAGPPWLPFEQEQRQGGVGVGPQHHHQSAAFASRTPNFLDPQGRRAMKQKRAAQQRQRLLRESVLGLRFI